MKKISQKGLIATSSRLVILLAVLVLTGCSSSTSVRDTAADADSETVDMGFNKVDKEKVVSSVSTVDDEDTSLIQPRSVADMLRGRVSGVTVVDGPGGTVQIRIRGNRSLTGGNDPLFVIDGMIVNFPDGMLQGVNPMDIQSITVLKDAGATAAYGSRGANGVIVITTKRGGS